MKKLLLTVLVVLTILFAQAQCQADFSYMQNGSTTIFTDLSTINSGWSTNYSITWDWDFGDGNFSTQQNPVHSYTNNGIYTPCLTVTYYDSTTINWCISLYCDSIFVGNSIPASWDCNPTTGCYDPGTGLGVYTSLASCQAVCVSTVSNACDSMTLISTGGSQQTMLVAEVPVSFMDVHYWITTAPDGTVLGEDSMWNSHQIFNNTNNGQPYDTINICITYLNVNAGFSNCCVNWVWNGSFWAKMGGLTSIVEIGSFDKKLIEVVDILGRATSINSNQTLFFIYEDGTIEKRHITDRK